MRWRSISTRKAPESQAVDSEEIGMKRTCPTNPRRLCLILCLMVICTTAALASESPVVDECLVIELAQVYRRSPVLIDPVEGAILENRWEHPTEGSEIRLFGDEKRRWTRVEADEEGWVRDPALRNGYAACRIVSDFDQIVLLSATGCTWAVVNGDPRVGDKYGMRYGWIPVSLKKGNNHLILRCLRGRLRVRFDHPRAVVMIDTRDMTLPDNIVGERADVWGSVLIVNAGDKALDGGVLVCGGGILDTTRTRIPHIPPLAVRKAGFLLRGPELENSGASRVRLRLERSCTSGSAVLDTASCIVRHRKSPDVHRRTFISRIDGSVQTYAVNPARKPGPSAALVLSVHGAGVEAFNQANAYSGKSWAHIVAPTNRRPFGYDWEDWGRLDAIEVLEEAQRRLESDRERVYLTGHSMGGHGTWHIGVTYPDRFAAIGPSAGWIRFATYAPRQGIDDPTPVEEIFNRVMLPGDPMALSSNFQHQGIYILHGALDENVPADQSRQMMDHLAPFHEDVVYHEENEAGHWWDNSDEPGADCVDWAPMFDFFARHALPGQEMIRRVHFCTANPGVSDRCHWLRIDAQTAPHRMSRASLRYDPGKRRVTGVTENVARICLNLMKWEPVDTLFLDIDGQRLKAGCQPGSGPVIWLSSDAGKWSVMTGPPDPSLKRAERYGPFKDVFRNRMNFVYGSRGTPEENAWAFAKARYDAECIWYQGNGGIDVIKDTDFDPVQDPDRNVILYGNRNTNAAWRALLDACPIVVKKGSVSVGKRKIRGNDLACLFLYPRPASDTACVGAVGGSGILGMRLTDLRPYLYSGYALPDCVVFDSSIIERGHEAVRAAGFFGLDWGVETGDFVWNIERSNERSGMSK